MDGRMRKPLYVLPHGPAQCHEGLRRLLQVIKFANSCFHSFLVVAITKEVIVIVAKLVLLLF